MKLLSILVICVLIFLGSGCARTTEFMGSTIGINIQDLEKMRAEGKSKVFALSYDEAFDRVIEILHEGGYTVFRSNKDQRYIVAMGFPRQVDTTRVGIFFDPAGEGETKVTLSCLSDTCLSKAAGIIFGGLAS